MGITNKNLRYLIDVLPGFIKKITIMNNDISIALRDASFIPLFIMILYKHQIFLLNQLLDLVVVDLAQAVRRFQIIYVSLSTIFNCRLNIVVFINEFEILKSLSAMFKSINWLEREAWDLFGIFVSNNVDLRRILTDYGFQGHPLRKDFPLSGFLEIIYNEEQKTVIYQDIEVTQEFRVQEGLSPWQNFYRFDR